MDAAGIANVAFTSEDHGRDVIRNVNADGFDSHYPRYYHRTRQRQGSMIRRYIAWRNRHVEDQQLRRIVARAKVA
jgi:hypothetical protein